MIIPFGPWRPDQPDFNNPCITAENVIPVENGYGPFLGETVITDALPAEPRGVISFRQVSGKRETFVGTETSLYRLDGETWTDVSNSNGYENSDFWRFAVYGSRLIATNGIDNPQKFDLASSTEFTDLSNAPTHRFPIVIKETLVALDLTDGSGDQVAFSAVNDSQTWSAAGGGGSQSFADGGPVVGGTGGEFGVILQEFGVTRMDFVGGDLRFTFDQVEGGIGCTDPASIVRYQGQTFYLSSDGFQSFDGAQSRNVSDQQVTKTFLADSVLSRSTSAGDTRVTSSGDTRVISETNLVKGALDPKNSLVAWSYPGISGQKIIMYNYRLGRWAEATPTVTQLHSSAQPGGLTLAGFNSSYELVLFTGTALTATLSTGELQLFKGRSGFVSSVRGLVDAAHDVTVGKKTDLADTETTTTGSSNSNGKCSVRSHGRYHRFELSPTAAFTEISGVDVEARQGGAKV